MGFDFSAFNDQRLKEAYVEWLINEEWPRRGEHFGRLWDYYENPMVQAGDICRTGGFDETWRPYIQAQEYGLPARITGRVYGWAGGVLSGRDVGDIRRKEVVIENDIGWRINAMVDFLFSKEVAIVSKAPQVERRREIESILRAVFEGNGGAVFFQDMAVLGSVYGFVDCLVRPNSNLLSRLRRRLSEGGISERFRSGQAEDISSVLGTAGQIDLELIEASRALPVLEEDDYRKIGFYVQHFYQLLNDVEESGGLVSRIFNGKSLPVRQKSVVVTEVLGPHIWQKYENFELAAEEVNPLGFVPVVHIQNIAQPYFYEGLSDVEQMSGLQDELNTRLSDRASRLTFQSFRMYLAKGIEGIEDKPVSPGRMWCTENPDASIEEFGGDGNAPSENMHIAEIREAMDKISGVTPVVAGVLKNKLGNLTSGVALKMTFMGMLTKTARKQFTYGQGIGRICRMALEILDRAGVYPTEASERQIEIKFGNPLPDDEMEKLKEAQIKRELGVPSSRVLEELGYESE